MTTVMIVSTYGPTGYGMGHDTTTPGAIHAAERVATYNGASDFDDMLRAAVDRYNLHRGDRIEVRILPVKEGGAE